MTRALAVRPKAPPPVPRVIDLYPIQGLQGGGLPVGAGALGGPAGLGMELAVRAGGLAVGMFRDAMSARQFTLEVQRVQIGTTRRKGRRYPRFGLRPTRIELTPTAGGILGAGLIVAAFGGLNGLVGAFRGAAASAGSASEGAPDWYQWLKKLPLPLPLP